MLPAGSVVSANPKPKFLSGIGTQHVKRTFWNAVRNVLPERVDNYTTQRGQCFLQNVKRENVSCCSERGT